MYKLLVLVSPGCSERLHTNTVVGVDKTVLPLSPVYTNCKIHINQLLKSTISVPPGLPLFGIKAVSVHAAGEAGTNESRSVFTTSSRQTSWQ